MRAILIDDEQLALDFLERQLKKVGNVTIVGKYTNPMMGLEYVTNHVVNIVFLDISMPEINGLELAEKIQSVNSEITVVFVTAHDEYAVTAFELNALDYIVKPIQINRLRKTIDRIKSNVRTTDKASPKNNLYVNVCQQLLIGQTKSELEMCSWRTAKAKELFLYLLQNENHLVRKAFLAELLWPDLDAERSFAQLYTAIYHVRNKLKEFSNHFTIKSSMEGYILETKNVFIDIKEWEKKIRSLPSVSTQTIDTYEEVMQLNHAPYLNEYDYLWMEADQYKYEQLWLKVSLEIGWYYYKKALLENAIIWYRTITDRHPTVEDAHLTLMMIYAMLDEQLLVKQQYVQLKNLLDDELGVKPSQRVLRWYEKWDKQTIKQ